MPCCGSGAKTVGFKGMTVNKKLVYQLVRAADHEPVNDQTYATAALALADAPSRSGYIARAVVVE